MHPGGAPFSINHALARLPAEESHIMTLIAGPSFCSTKADAQWPCYAPPRAVQASVDEAIAKRTRINRTIVSWDACGCCESDTTLTPVRKPSASRSRLRRKVESLPGVSMLGSTVAKHGI